MKGYPEPTQEELKLVDRVRAALCDVPDDDDHAKLDEDVVRFLRARNGNVKKAAAMLSDCLRWRKEVRPWKLSCPACEELSETPGMHSLRQVGFDRHGRAVMYTCYRQCHDGMGWVDGAKHLIYALENAHRSMVHRNKDGRYAGGGGQWLWVIDCSGFGLKNCNVSQAREPVRILQSYYPERLCMFVVMNAPSMAGTFLRMLKPFLDPDTYAKVEFINGKPCEQTEKLRRIFGPDNDAIPWIMKEIEENRKQPYPEAQRRFWEAPTFADNAAGPSYVAEYIDGPAKALGDGGLETECWPGGAMPHPSMYVDMRGETLSGYFDRVGGNLL